MLRFHPITLADKPVIESFTYPSERRNCDLSFINLFGWSTFYHTEYALYEGFLLFRFETNDHLAYMFPLGEGDTKGVLEAMLLDASSQERPFLLLGVCSYALDQLEEAMPNCVTFSSNEDYADYIYPREQLATLSGKKLQSKRNHVNKFMRSYPNHSYRPLTAELVPQCMALYDKWVLHQHSNNAEGVVAERNAMWHVLSNMDALNLIGGALFVDDKLVAFTYGSGINYDTFDVCVEKADIEYDGAYTTVNQLFAKSLPAKYILINREEDLGIEGLRKAKQSYYPSQLLLKHSARLKHPFNELCRRSLKAQTRALWERCFQDPKDFVDLYFEKKYSHEANIYALQNGEVAAAMQCLPYTLTYQGSEVSINYLSGVCTDERYRNKGLMRRLMHEAHATMYERGVLFSTLIPAEEWLFGYYQRLGYTTVAYHQLIPYQPAADAMQLSLSAWNGTDREEEIYQFFAQQMKRRPTAVQHSQNDFQVIVADIRLAKGQIFLARNEEDALTALAFTVNREGICHLLECLAITEETEQGLLAAIAHEVAVPIVVHRREMSPTALPFGQLRVLNAERALSLYAANHPALVQFIAVHGDTHIPQNNRCYQLANGKCVSMDQTESSPTPTHTFSIHELAGYLFTDNPLTMSLMLN